MTVIRQATKNEVPQWFMPAPARTHSPLRLFCFPYAGGGASLYRPWQSAWPREIDVCSVHLPGRERRFCERPFSRIEPLLESLSAAIEPWLDRPFALFGHSMGALIAFELARLLAPRPSAPLLHLFVSGRAAPHLPITEPILHGLPDDELIAELRRFRGTPEALLNDPETMRLMLPLIRADFELVERYAYRPGPPLACGISVFGGRDDDRVGEDKLQGWRLHTKGSFRLRIMRGDHFFINAAPADLLRAVRDDLRARH